jgi:hypothetical protein
MTRLFGPWQRPILVFLSFGAGLIVMLTLTEGERR